MYLCMKHRDQFNRLGRFLDYTNRDPNTCVDHGDYFSIVFFDSKGQVIGEAFIDTEDVERCKQYHWQITEPRWNTRYVRCKINGKLTGLHRFILNSKDNDIVDHINRNGLDNRKRNLRNVTVSENIVNSKTRSATGEKNIYLRRNHYQVQIVRNYKKVFCSTCDTLEEAVAVRDAFIKEYNNLNNRKV